MWLHGRLFQSNVSLRAKQPCQEVQHYKPHFTRLHPLPPPPSLKSRTSHRNGSRRGFALRVAMHAAGGPLYHTDQEVQTEGLLSFPTSFVTETPPPPPLALTRNSRHASSSTNSPGPQGATLASTHAPMSPSSPSTSPFLSPQTSAIQPPLTLSAYSHSRAALNSPMRPQLRPPPSNNPVRRGPPLLKKFNDKDQQVAVFDCRSVEVRCLSGGPPPYLLSSFNELRNRPYFVAKLILRAMHRQRLCRPTLIQKYAIPAIHRGYDVLASSETGSGKTVAYLLPILSKLQKRQRDGAPHNSAYPEAVILVPTRELAVQVWEVAHELIKGGHQKVVALHGGSSMVDESMKMRGGVDLVVATPKRLLEHVESRKVLKLDRVAHLVVDEADSMTQQGLEQELRRLLAHPSMPLPEQRQTMLFTASLPPAVLQLATHVLRPDALHIQVGDATGAGQNVKHEVKLLTSDMKDSELLQCVNAVASLSIVFVNTRKRAEKVHALLVEGLGSGVSLLHADMTHASREEAMQCFRYGVTPVLVTTDIASRGLDIPDVAQVMNYDMPEDFANLVYRVGRTGRGGRSGMAYTFLTPNDAHLAPQMVQLMQAVKQTPHPWLSEMMVQQVQVQSARQGEHLACSSSTHADQDRSEFGGGVRNKARSGSGKGAGATQSVAKESRSNSSGSHTSSQQEGPPPVKPPLPLRLVPAWKQGQRRQQGGFLLPRVVQSEGKSNLKELSRPSLREGKKTTTLALLGSVQKEQRQQTDSLLTTTLTKGARAYTQQQQEQQQQQHRRSNQKGGVAGSSSGSKSVESSRKSRSKGLSPEFSGPSDTDLLLEWRQLVSEQPLKRETQKGG